MAKSSGPTGTGQAPYPYAEPSDTEEWSQDFLYGTGAPLEQGLYGGSTETAYVEQWEQNESPSGYGYNPLGTEETEPGSWDANSAGVQGYTSWGEGLQATYDTLAGNPNNENLVSELQSGDASVAELDTAQSYGSWKTGNEPNLTGQGANVPFTYTGSQSGTVQGYGNAGTAGAASKAPGWLLTLDSYLRHGQAYGANPTGGTFGGVEDTAVEIFAKVSVGAVGFVMLLGGMIVVFGPSFLHKAGTATGFGQPGQLLQSSQESSRRAAAIRSDIEQREAQRETFRAARAEQQQQFDLAKINARKEANLAVAEAKSTRRTRSSDVPGPSAAAKPRPRQMTPPPRQPGPKRTKTGAIPMKAAPPKRNPKLRPRTPAGKAAQESIIQSRRDTLAHQRAINQRYPTGEPPTKIRG